VMPCFLLRWSRRYRLILNDIEQKVQLWLSLGVTCLSLKCFLALPRVENVFRQVRHLHWPFSSLPNLGTSCGSFLTSCCYIKSKFAISDEKLLTTIGGRQSFVKPLLYGNYIFQHFLWDFVGSEKMLIQISLDCESLGTVLALMDLTGDCMMLNMVSLGTSKICKSPQA